MSSNNMGEQMKFFQLFLGELVLSWVQPLKSPNYNILCLTAMNPWNIVKQHLLSFNLLDQPFSDLFSRMWSLEWRQSRMKEWK